MQQNDGSDFTQTTITSLQQLCQQLAQQKAIAQQNNQSEVYIEKTRQLTNTEKKIAYWQAYQKRNQRLVD